MFCFNNPKKPTKEELRLKKLLDYYDDLKKEDQAYTNGGWVYDKNDKPVWYQEVIVAIRAKDGSRSNWTATTIYKGNIQGRDPADNDWRIPILDDDNYEVYAWMYYPDPPKENPGEEEEEYEEEDRPDEET